MKRVLLNSGKAAVLGAFALTFLASLTSIALAGPHDQARFALHTKVNFKNNNNEDVITLCDYAPTNPLPLGEDIPCTDYVTTFSGKSFPGPHIFLVVGQGNALSGIAGASCGIDYVGGGGTGINPQFVVFTACTNGLILPNDGGNGDFPKPGGGMRMTWLSCQNHVPPGGAGVHTAMGALYVYAYLDATSLQVTPNNNLSSGPELNVVGCGITGESFLLDVYGPNASGAMGRVDFYGNGPGPGYTPCGVVPAQPTTWGKLKNQYKSNEE